MLGLGFPAGFSSFFDVLLILLVDFVLRAQGGLLVVIFIVTVGMAISKEADEGCQFFVVPLFLGRYFEMANMKQILILMDVYSEGVVCLYHIVECVDG